MSLRAGDRQLEVRRAGAEHPHRLVAADEEPGGGHLFEAHASTGSGVGNSIASCAARIVVNAQIASH